MANCNIDIVLCDDKFSVCGDVGLNLNDLLTTDISTINTLKEFNDVISSELINVKGWKTESSYPTLRLLYDRYMNSIDYTSVESSRFDYNEMIKFSELVGTYWVDLIEQVIPSTTIWGSTYVYRNTIFDQQKFKYKKYSLFTCELPTYSGDVVSPMSGWDGDIQVELETLPNDITITGDTATTTTITTTTGDTTIPTTTGDTIEIISFGNGDQRGQTPTSPFANITYKRNNGNDCVEPVPLFTCNGVGIIQMNCGSEFVGRIVDYGASGINGDVINISECSISVEIGEIIETSPSVYSASAIISGDITGPVTYLWSDGQTTSTAVGLTSGSYTLTVFDEGILGCSKTIKFIIQ